MLVEELDALFEDRHLDSIDVDFTAGLFDLIVLTGEAAWEGRLASAAAEDGAVDTTSEGEEGAATTVATSATVGAVELEASTPAATIATHSC